MRMLSTALFHFAVVFCVSTSFVYGVFDDDIANAQTGKQTKKPKTAVKPKPKVQSKKTAPAAAKPKPAAAKPRPVAAATAPMPTAPMTDAALPQIAPPPRPKAPVAPGTQSVAEAPAAEAAPAPPNPWKLVYIGEYVGPRLQRIAVDETQGPDELAPGYASWDHALKLGHTVISNNFVIGGVVSANHPFDPWKKFEFYDMILYLSLANIIDNDFLNMQMVVDNVFPTSEASQLKKRIIRFNIKNNWTLKTNIRNWNFSFLTYVSPRFYDEQTAPQADLLVGVFPTAAVDLAPDWQLQFEGGFDAVHMTNFDSMDFNAADPDYINIGPVYNGIPHVSLNPALRFYTGNISFKAAVLYLGMSVAL